MDLDLTGQILGMPFSLIGKATQDIKITDLIPLVAVILTAIFTYFITATIQERNHRKELKRQVYFELIDVITKIRKVNDDNRRYPVNEDPKTQTADDRDRIDREMTIPYTFIAAKFKIYAVGSKEFNNLIDTMLEKGNPVRNGTNSEFQEFLGRLIIQMQKELVEPTIKEKIVSWLHKCKNLYDK